MKTNRLQLAGIIQGEKGETGKTSYEYAVDKGYQGTEEEFSQAIKDTLDAKETVAQSKEEVLAAKQETLTAKESVDSSKTEVLAAKKSVDASKSEVEQLNTQFESKVTESVSKIQNEGSKVVGDIADAKEESLSSIQQAGTTQTNKVTEAGTTAVGNINTTKDQSIVQLQNKGSEMLESINSGSVTEVTGSLITADGTAQGSAIAKEIQGGMKQIETLGRNLLNDKNFGLDIKIKSYSWLNNVLNIEVEESESTVYFKFNIEKPIDKLKGKTLCFSDYTSDSELGCRIWAINASGNSDSSLFSEGFAPNKKLTIQTDISDTIRGFCIGIGVLTGKPRISKISNLYVYLEDEPLEKWEPFTGGAPSPSPDYPQEIKSIGGNGLFDGFLKQGRYIDGKFSASESYVSSDKYECKPEDKIKLVYEKKAASLEITFWNENGSYSKIERNIGYSELEVVAPASSKYFAITINDSKITTQNAKRISVIINDKYTAKVKTNGKNLLDFFKVHNPNNNSISKKIGENEYEMYALGDLYRNHYILSDEDTDITISGIIKNKSSKDDWTVDILNSSDTTVARIREGTETSTGKGCKLRINFITSQDGSVFKNIMACKGNENTEFEPYKETISYIPLDYPLYEGDKIYLEDGELWEYRENARVVLDGSESWFADTGNRLYSQKNNMKRLFDYKASVICDRLVTSKNHANMIDENISGYSDSTNLPNENWIYIKKSNITSAQELKTWLQSNPLEVVYKLVTPTRKKLGSAEAFKLRTFDERTYIEVVGAKDLNTQNTFIVPKNQLGGLATEAFATSKQNAYKFENMDEVINAEDLHSYGFVEHMDILSPANRIEYVGLNKDYRPMHMDLENSTTDYGSWGNFPSLVHNKPYMVKSTGEADYQLDENDYNLKATGGDSDVSNTEYDGGAFSKFIKVYVKRWVEGNDRHVRFSYIPLEGYYPCGFVDTGGLEMDHVWLPMFYGSTVSGKMKSIAGTQPDINQNTDTQNKNITAFSERAAFFGGPIIETIKDMMYMLFKTTNIQEACGKGNSSGYDSASSPYHGVHQNYVIGEGQFYGNTNGKSLNKILHSIVLGSYQQYQRDPYYLVVNGRYKVSTDYTYDPTGEKYIDTGINSETVTANKWLYPHISKPVDGFGCIPIAPLSGSSSTGYCDGVYHPADKNFTAVVLRFGRCGAGSTSGLACSGLTTSAAYSTWDISASVLLRPPVAT